MRFPRPAQVLVGLECALVVAVLAVQLPRWWEARWVQDDAYVSFRYARNLVRGHGLVYNAGQPVEGYTNFLWTLLAAVPLARGAEDPLPFMHLVSAGCWIASYGLLLGLLLGLARAGLWAAPLAALPLAVHWSYNMWFFSGMETPLASLLTIAAVGCVTIDPRRRAWALGAASLCGVGLMMTRPDGVVVCAALALAVGVLDGRWIVRERRWGRGALAPALPLLLLFAPYQAWRLWFYGAPLPNTYYAKVAYLTHYPRGWTYLRTYVELYALHPFLALPIVGLGLAAPGPAQRFLLAALLAAAAVAFYVVRLGGDFMEWRFLTPVSGVFYPAAVVGAAAIGTRLAAAALRRRPDWAPAGGWLVGAGAAAALTLVTAGGAEPAQNRGVPDQETIALLRRYTDPGRFDWRAAARLFDEVLPPGVRIATTSAGIVPYFCDRPCIDLHGLTDPVIARTPIDPERRGRMGHEHWLEDYGEMRRRGVDVVLEWVDPSLYPHAVATPPGDGRELVSVRMPDGRFVDFTLLDPSLRPQLARDERVVLHDPTRIADRGHFHLLSEHFGGLATVDRLDWGFEESETAHALRIAPAAGAPYEESWHTKLLAHVPPRQAALLEDNGRRVWGSAEWEVHGISTAADLVLVTRHDHTGDALFDVDVNGRRAPKPLAVTWRPAEAWGETALVIPRALLRDGTNRIRLTRRPSSERDAEFYFMWFLQPPAHAPG